MARLMKEMRIGEEIIFDLEHRTDNGKRISVTLTAIVGKKLIFKLEADPSIKYRFVKQVTIPG